MKEAVEPEVPVVKEPVEVPAQKPEDVVATAEETPEEPAKVEEEIPRRGGRTPYTPKPRSKRGKREDEEVEVSNFIL